MTEKRQRMPKKARYPLFIVGLAIILVGSLALNSAKAGADPIAGAVLVGFAFLMLSVGIA